MQCNEQNRPIDAINGCSDRTARPTDTAEGPTISSKCLTYNLFFTWTQTYSSQT